MASITIEATDGSGSFAAYVVEPKAKPAGAVVLIQEIFGVNQAMRDAAVAIRPDVLVLCHGGPIAEPQDAAYVLERTRGVVGFFGASSMERLPTEVAMTENMRRFKAMGGAA